MDILSVTTTVGSFDDARRLAAGLVERRLAACVQLEQLESHYRWQGRLCAEPEVRLTVKTVPRRLEALQAFVAEHHPYDVPQLLWQTLQASEPYGRWVEGETS